MSYEEWIQRTRLGLGAIRPAKLRAVDLSLNVYNRIPTEDNQRQLRKALMALITEKGFEALKKDPRNSTNAIEELFGQVVLGRRTMPFSLKNDLVKVAQGRIQAQIFGGDIQQTVVDQSGKLTRIKVRKVGHLHQSDTMLKIVAEHIQRDLDCKISYGPIKTLESASRKVTDDYGGDWYQLKDGVRITVIATNGGKVTGVTQDNLGPIGSKIRMVCVPSSGLTIIKDEEAVGGLPDHRPKDNPCGYSGLNFAIRLTPGGESRLVFANGPAIAPGWPGEIQANIPAMMYGKMSEKDFCRIFSQEEHGDLSRDLGIEGGIGHVFYEIWRVDRTGPDGTTAANLGGRYHDYLRDPRTLQGGKDALKREIDTFKRRSAFISAKFGNKH